MRGVRAITMVGLCALFVILTMPVSADSSFPHALVHNSCAPWDGGAVEIILTKEPAQCNRTDGPHLAIGVWRGFPLHAGQEVQFAPGSDAGFASQCAKDGQCEQAESGAIVFDQYQDDSRASGHYELHFKGARVLSGIFDAQWCKERVVCG